MLDNQEVTIFSRFTPNHTETGVDMTLWIRLKDGAYFSAKSNKKDIDKLKDWLLRFNQHLEKLDEKTEYNMKGL